MGHGDPMDRLPAREARRAGAPAVVGEIPADGNLPRSRHGERAARALVPLALHRRRDHGRGEQRPRLPGDRRLRQAGVEAAGAPLRLALPWKYGFKSIKSITKFTFTDQRPKTFWEALQASEYGFWANVNPEVSHPRWSQATEQVIGTTERRPTLLFNGYGEYVADLYKDVKGERLWA